MRERRVQVVEGRERAVERRRGRKHEVLAVVVVARQAARARTARHAGLERDAVADLAARHVAADGGDDARRLVPEHHRRTHDKVADAPVRLVVAVGAAQARLAHVHTHLVRLQRRHRAVLKHRLFDVEEHVRLVALRRGRRQTVLGRHGRGTHY